MTNQHSLPTKQRVKSSAKPILIGALSALAMTILLHVGSSTLSQTEFTTHFTAMIDPRSMIPIVLAAGGLIGKI